MYEPSAYRWHFTVFYFLGLQCLTIIIKLIHDLCLDFLQVACTESLDGQVQGAITHPSHP